MAYNTATVVESFVEGDGRARLNIRYTGNAGEPPMDFPLYVNQAQAVDQNYIRGQAMQQISTLNQNRAVATATAAALPMVLDVSTPLPTVTPPTITTPTNHYAATDPFTPGATPQDVFTIIGSATKVVTVTRIGISTLQTTAGVNTWHLLKRSTANVGGTLATIASILDGSTAATAVVRRYTANPTSLGTLVARPWCGRVSSPAPATAGIGSPNIDLNIPRGITLNGVAESLAWNFNGVALPAGLSVMGHFLVDRGLMILVLGVPRSGTSCVAGILHHLGIPMGDEQMEPNEWNRKGFFHDLEFEAIFDACRDYHEPTDFDPSGLMNLVEKRNAQYEKWGVKSNRLAFFLPWLKPAVTIRTKRAKAASVRSWMTRTGWDEPRTAAMMERIENAIPQCDLTVDYDELLANPREGVERIADTVGVPVTEHAIAFVDPSLRRFRNG